MKTFTLLPEEREDLVRLGKQIKDVKGAIRVRVILALDTGYTIKEVADILLLDEDTVSKWRKKYQKRQFFSDWLQEYYAGYDGKLTKAQIEEIEGFVKKHTVTDCREVAAYIRAHYGKAYTIAGVTKLLHRLGFVYKQVVLVPGKLDEAKQEAFLTEYTELKENKKDSEVILFGDGVHPTHNIHKTKAWIKRGEDKQIKTNTGRGRLNINGALNLETLTVTTHFSETINAQETMKLFDKIQLVYQEKTTIYLIIDNARYYKNKDVTAYLARKDCRIKLIFLPAYSPNLNFIERLWKFMKKYIIGITYREKFKQFEYDIHQFFDNISQYEDRLRQFIGSELHLVKLTS
ncbi:MAG: IS630 family transposase [Candidatus Levyibacteriota bacterium]